MKDDRLQKLVREEGLQGAFLAPQEIPVNPEYRRFCEENLCGKYHANYACPPDCGTPEQMHRKILAEDRALVVSVHWTLDQGLPDAVKKDINVPVVRLWEKMRALGYAGFAVGFSGCALCQPCRCTEGKPCPYPQKRISCMSAYCVDVAQLAKRCGMEFAWREGELHLFGMVLFHEEQSSR